MKKIFGIILAICCLGSAFAGNPTENYSIAEFSGEAGVKYVQNLDYKADTNKFGFENWANANLKINLLNGDNATTKGKGIWGEIKVKIDTPDALPNPGQLNIDKTAAVDTAKIHFVDGDFAVALNILAPSLELGNASIAAATGTTESTTKNKVADYNTGFAVEITTPVADVNVKVADNGVAAEKKFGFAADAKLKAVENLDVNGAFAYADETTAFRAGANYKLAINDKLYVKPAVDYTQKGEAKDLAAGILFGWGADEQEPGLDYIADKCADGVSVVFGTDLTEKAGNVVVGFYDSTLVAGLKVGAQFGTTLANFGRGKLAVAAKYGTDIDIITVSLHGGVELTLADETTTNFKYGIKLNTDDVIDNTDLYVSYEGEKDKKGKIVAGAKISL